MQKFKCEKDTWVKFPVIKYIYDDGDVDDDASINVLMCMCCSTSFSFSGTPLDLALGSSFERNDPTPIFIIINDGTQSSLVPLFIQSIVDSCVRRGAALSLSALN